MDIKSGVYVLDSNAVSALLLRADKKFQVFNLSLERIPSKLVLLEALKHSFALPDYVGSNWDALEESLRDLPTDHKEGFVLCVDPGEALLDLSRNDLYTFISILRGTAAFWASEGIVFATVFVSSSGALMEAVADKQG